MSLDEQIVRLLPATAEEVAALLDIPLDVVERRLRMMFGIRVCFRGTWRAIDSGPSLPYLAASTQAVAHALRLGQAQHDAAEGDEQDVAQALDTRIRRRPTPLVDALHGGNECEPDCAPQGPSVAYLHDTKPRFAAATRGNA